MDLKHTLVLALACILVATAVGQAQVGGIFGKAGLIGETFETTGAQIPSHLPAAHTLTKDQEKWAEEGAKKGVEELAKEGAKKGVEELADQNEAENLKGLSNLVMGTTIFGWLLF